MPQQLAFVVVNNHNELKNAEHQKRIQRHIGRFHRNRSKPAQRLQQERDALAQRKRQHELIAKEISPEHIVTPAPTILTASGAPSKQVQGEERCHTESVETDDLIVKNDQLENIDREANLTVVERAPSSPQEQLIALLPTSDFLEDQADGDKELDEHWHKSDLFNLDQSRDDPFATYPVEDDFNRQTSILVDHAVQHFWSNLSPDRQYGVQNPVNNIYLMHMRSTPVAYYTYSIVISTNFDYLTDSPMRKKFQSLRAKHMHAATQLVRKKIQAMPDKPTPDLVTDELIGAVMGLSSNHRINVITRTKWPAPRFHSPLATLQCLDMFGALPFIRPHRLAVVQMVSMRGGPQNLGSYMAGVVQLNDLIDASQNIGPPMIAHRFITIDLPGLQWPPQKACDEDTDQKLAQGFTILPHAILTHNNLHLALTAIAETTQALDHYNANGRPPHLIAHLVETRNRAHHMTLSLGIQSQASYWSVNAPMKASLLAGLDTLTGQDDLFEVIYLTLLIYNNLVIYPLPPASGVHVRHVKALKMALTAVLISDTCWFRKYFELLLWSVMLGGISDPGDTERDWYKDRFRYLLGLRPDLRKWSRLEQVLSTFFWSDLVLNEEAVKFWSDAVQVEAKVSDPPPNHRQSILQQSHTSSMLTPSSITSD